MNINNRLLETLVGQRNAALDAAAIAAAQRDEAVAAVEEANKTIEKLQQRLHELAADEAGPSGATPKPDEFRGD
jgi:hypothetical protein